MNDAELKQFAREQIAHLFCHNLTDVIDWEEGWDNYSDWEKCKSRAFAQADQILALTKPDGTKLLGIISDEQELPKPHLLHDSWRYYNAQTAYKQAQEDITDAGFVRLVNE